MVDPLGQNAFFTPRKPPPFAREATGTELSPRTLDKMRAARQAVTQASQMASQLASQRKANAGVVVDQVKQQLGKMSLAAVIDPKGTARYLKVLMKQLASAVRDYAHSGNPREARAEADRMEAQLSATEARLTGSEPAPPRPAAETARLEAADTAAEKAFLEEARQVRRKIEKMFGDAYRAAVAREGKTPELKRLAQDFNADRTAALKNEKAIAAWSAPAASLGAAPILGALDIRL